MRPIPCDKFAERAVLGKLFYCPDRLPDIDLQLNAEDFFWGKHRSVWRAMTGLLHNDTVIDLPSVWQWIESRGNPHAVTRGQIALLGNECTAADLDAQVSIIKQLSALRKLIEVVTRIDEQARHSQDDVSAFLSRSLEQVIDATSSSVSGEPIKIGANIDEMVSQAMDPNPVRTIRVPTGIVELDKVLGGGLLNQQLNTVLARTSMGKTSVLANIASGLSQQGPVLWFSFEETRQQLQFLLASIHSGIPYSTMQNGHQVDKAITLAAAAINQMPIYISRERTGVDAIVQKCMAFRGRHGDIGGIIIDHSMLIHTTGKEFRATYELFNRLSELPGRAKCPLVVAHQTNRAPSKRDNQRPTLEDMRDGGEEPSKVIIGLYRDHYYTGDPNTLNSMEAIVLKNKGPVGTAYLDIDITCARIFNREDF